ncbi:MAG: spore coat protein [Firmicutes bacterium]|nr:spore coat protein [Bacillota bacterium]
MLSQMDLSLIKDHLHDHKAGINKLNYYLDQVQNPNLQQVLQQQIQTMENHYNIMLNLLNT